MPSTACHNSPYSGTWYPGDRRGLEELLDELFKTSLQRTGSYLLPQPAAFIVPHAGLAYSGRVAAAVYRHLEQCKPRRIVLLGFSHRGAPSGTWIPDVEAFRTPLGITPVDMETVRDLLAHDSFRLMPEEALCDHSVEIQLPLLQKAVPDAAVVPIYVSSLSKPERNRAAKILAGLLEPGSVALASSDFTHYGDAFHYKPFPRDAAIASRLRHLDESFMEAAGSIMPGFFIDALDAESATVCGRQPISLLLAALRALPEGEEIFQTTLDYETSGDISGDYSHTVSYAALGYFPWDSFHLGDDDQIKLLESAKATLNYYQETGKPKPIPPPDDSAALKRSCGAFVTLHQQGRLRGCVGRCTGLEPLAKVVPDMTLAAALEDSRFPPLKTGERHIDIEVSILSPMKRLPDASHFRVNRDGGYLRAAGFSGLLLPHVAQGRNWSSQDFLDALAQKSGAGNDIYQEPGTKLFVFRTQIIH